jgi:hypothetical protein
MTRTATVQVVSNDMLDIISRFEERPAAHSYFQLCLWIRIVRQGKGLLGRFFFYKQEWVKDWMQKVDDGLLWDGMEEVVIGMGVCVCLFVCDMKT